MQRQLLATLCTAEPLIRRPFVLDVDDAIFLGPRGHHADRIARRAQVVICGNAFIAEHFGAQCTVTVLPTAVDTQRFTPGGRTAAAPTLGWSGSAGGFPYLVAIQPALQILMACYPDLRLRVISNAQPQLPMLPASRIDYVKWSPDNEVGALQDLTVGLMPLADTLWERGKCSFKMLTYMACGVPVVVTPVGMNLEVLARADVGYAARGRDAWVDAIADLLDAPSRARAMGANGRRVVSEHYALDVVAERLAALLEAQLA
ncbi:glycosyltransferase [Roseateles sp.]|uniref:glycosyltransferase n=1 Tax=Roseateles sp. TaxID=1971397 RepID=UPI003BA8C3E3